jgi:hypothetical protein
MVRAEPSLATSVLWAYWDLCHALRALWRQALIALAILCVGVLLAEIGPRLLDRDGIARVVDRQMCEIAMSFLLTPFVIAIQRFVLLGEVTPHYRIDPANARFRLMFGWLATMSVLANIPSLLDVLTAPSGPITYVGIAPTEAGPSILVAVTFSFALLTLQRLIVLLPAIALGAPGATWQNAFRDTQARLWFVLLASILPLVPLGLIGAVAAPLLWQSITSYGGLLAAILWLGTAFLIFLTLGAVVASRLYQLFGDSLNRATSAA